MMTVCPDTLYAVLADDQTVCGIHIGPTFMPLVFLDRAKLASMRILAQTVANVSGRTVSICEFTGRAVIDTIHPK